MLCLALPFYSDVFSCYSSLSWVTAWLMMDNITVGFGFHCIHVSLTRDWTTGKKGIFHNSSHLIHDSFSSWLSWSRSSIPHELKTESPQCTFSVVLKLLDIILWPRRQYNKTVNCIRLENIHVLLLNYPAESLHWFQIGIYNQTLVSAVLQLKSLIDLRRWICFFAALHFKECLMMSRSQQVINANTRHDVVKTDGEDSDNLHHDLLLTFSSEKMQTTDNGRLPEPLIKEILIKRRQQDVLTTCLSNFLIRSELTFWFVIQIELRSWCVPQKDAWTACKSLCCINSFFRELLFGQKGSYPCFLLDSIAGWDFYFEESFDEVWWRDSRCKDSLERPVDKTTLSIKMFVYA